MRMLFSSAAFALMVAANTSAQVGSVTGTVDDTTRIQSERLDLNSTTQIGSTLRPGAPVSRIDQMRERRALREARRTAADAREIESPGLPPIEAQGAAEAASEATVQAERIGEARSVSQTAARVSESRVSEGRISGQGSAEASAAAANRIERNASADISATAEPAGAVSRILTRAETTTARIDAAVETPAAVDVSVPAPSATVVAPSSTVVTGGSSRTVYTGPRETVIVRDRTTRYEPSALTPAADQPMASTSRAQPAPNIAPSRITWIDRDQVVENAFPLSCALLLILALLMAAWALQSRRRAA
ncbi:hypothetical protein [Hyphobacterium sp.]|uniref:hypothetical protein n=1 Tax=Hyphobacterium sp. TaxID=2004662 RepID=UPI003BA8B09F